ncbi:hypothetical protein CL634_04915 [bacterium]|nr:hypothetical protein [bacterium]|tara:strand:+ start:664 stop:888 length:225 start_codon:yes stop_codon:yes gene_type:complete
MKRTETETNTNQLTTVKTAYARVAVLLLALNFGLTGYVVYSMNNTMQTQIDNVTGAAEPQPLTGQEARGANLAQ